MITAELAITPYAEFAASSYNKSGLPFASMDPYLPNPHILYPSSQKLC
jgi:hypothetical protein